MKLCRKCQTTKPLSDFYFDKNRNTYSAPCKQCRRTTVLSSNNAWRKSNRDRYNKAASERKLFLNYGLTLDEVIKLWESQEGFCAICRKPILIETKEKSEKFHVDHDHVTGEVRGLLCLTCNTGIGMLNDSPDLLEAAKQYLLSRGATTEKSLRRTVPVSAEINQTVYNTH